MQWSVFLTHIDKDTITIYTTQEYSASSELLDPILLISHEFSHTGAPIALLNMVKVLCSTQHPVFVLCSKDGILRTDFVENGANVIIYPAYNSDNSWIIELSKIFSTVVNNTLSLLNAVVSFFKIFKKIYWWLHESEYMFECVDSQVIQQLGINLYTLSKNNFTNIVFVAVSPLVAQYTQKYLGAEAHIIPPCVPDINTFLSAMKQPDRISFLQIGSINANKRPDILTDAALRLPEHLFQKCTFTFIGNKKVADTIILSKLSEFAESFFNVRFLSAMAHNDIYNLYDEADIVVVTSLQETLSIVAVEACMKRKICICANTAGITDFMKTGNEMLIFPAGDIDALYEKIIYVIENYESLNYMRNEGRNMYEEYFSEKAFEKNIDHLFNI